MQFSAALFLDNDAGHIRAVSEGCPNITCIKVPCTEPLEPKFPDIDFYRHLSPAGKEAYATIMESALAKSEMYDRQSGIDRNTLVEVANWIQTHQGENGLVALIDFDRTLTVFEGIDSNVLTLDNITPEGYAEYIFGGSARMDRMKSLFHILHMYKIKIIILTNNGICRGEDSLLRALVFTLADKAEVEFICSRPRSAQATEEDWFYSKINAIIADERFVVLCGAKGGGKNKKMKRKTRRNRK